MWNPRAFKGQVSPHELLQASIEIMDGMGWLLTYHNRKFPMQVTSDSA